jgi:hypothetical protein
MQHLNREGGARAIGVSKINYLGPVKQVIVSPEGPACPLVTPRGEITWRTVRSHTAAMRTQQ